MFREVFLKNRKAATRNSKRDWHSEPEPSVPHLLCDQQKAGAGSLGAERNHVRVAIGQGPDHASSLEFIPDRVKKLLKELSMECW